MKSYRLLVPLAIGVAFAVAACGSAQPNWNFPASGANAAGNASTTVAAKPAEAAGGAATAGGATVSSVSGAVTTGASTAGGGSAGEATVRQPATLAASTTLIHQDITIVTGDMIGKTEYPAFVPSAIMLPANSLVLVTITNFDDATPLPKGSEQYAKTTGTVGAAVVQPIDLTDPNASKGKASAITSLNPDDVSHTFTIPSLGINVPIAAHARESFLIRTGAPGTYMFRCFDPCGAGPTGWGTAMAAKDYMQGTITVI